MMTLHLIILGLIILAGVAGCGNTSNEQQTLDAFGTDFEQRLDNLYASATIDIEQVIITVEQVGTRIARAQDRQDEMVFTLEARGIDTSILPDAIQLVQLPTPNHNTNPTGSNAAATPPAITPPGTIQMTPTSLTEAIESRLLSNIVLSTHIGEDDCATHVMNTFLSSTEKIYVVATAQDIPANTTFSTRWWRDTEELAFFEFTYDFIEEGCIWFFVDKSDFAFTPDIYRVQFFRDNQPESPLLSFTITQNI